MPYQSNRGRPTGRNSNSNSNSNRNRGRKPRYRIKPVPVIIAAILVVGIIAGIVWGVGQIVTNIKGDKDSSSGSSSSSPSSEQDAGNDSSDGDSSDGGSSDGDSSDGDSSEGSSDSAVAANHTDSSSEAPSSANSSKAASSDKTSSTASTAGASSDTASTAPASPAAAPGTISNSYNSVKEVASIENDPLWNLILLNPGNKISTEIPMTRVKVGGYYVDSRAADSYNEMYNAAGAAGYTLFMRSGYRSIKAQDTNYNAEIARQQKELNKSKEDAIKGAERYYTRPGHSEHHAGLAVDIVTADYNKYIYTLSAKFAEDEAYKWLVANCANYGFILRYPKDKEAITQISFEPWHYRYVGKDHAKVIMESGICLEEYIAEMEGKFAEVHPDKIGTEEEHNAFAAFAKAYPANR